MKVPQSKSSEKIVDVVRIHDPNDLKATQLSDCNKLFKQFVQRMKYHYPLLKYMAVVARQETGCWHYHFDQRIMRRRQSYVLANVKETRQELVAVTASAKVVSIDFFTSPICVRNLVKI